LPYRVDAGLDFSDTALSLAPRRPEVGPYLFPPFAPRGRWRPCEIHKEPNTVCSVAAVQR
jgi:hypothetical protein